jgi:hypothetical protein
MLGFPKSTLGRIGFIVVLGAMSQACKSTDETTSGTGGGAGASQAGETSNAGNTNQAGDKGLDGGAAGAVTDGGAAGAVVADGGAAGAVVAEGGAAGAVVAEGGAAGAVVAEGGAAGAVVAEGGAAGAVVAEGGAAGAAGEPVVGGLVKFCNNLYKIIDSESIAVELTVRINDIDLVADSSTCAPVMGCTGIDAGDNIDVTILDGTTELNTVTVPVIYDGDELLITTGLDADSMPIPDVDLASGICSGGDATAGTVAKFCNYMYGQDDSGEPVSIIATLDVDGTKLEAESGTCAPIAACTAIPSGTDVPLTLSVGDTDILTGTWNIEDGSEMVFWARPDGEGGALFDASQFAGICAPGLDFDVISFDAPAPSSGWSVGKKQQTLRSSPTGLFPIIDG